MRPMELSNILLIAFGLAMDAFAVAVASGVIIKRQRLRRAVVFGVMFGGFQMLMPVAGYGAGCAFRAYIAAFDHWIAFGLLSAVGLKMIYEALRMEEMERTEPAMTGLVLLGLSIATSIDALAVGISFAVLHIALLFPVVIIGAVTFCMSFSGFLFGNKFGSLLEKKAEIAGGLVLVGMGIKILIEHLA